MPVLYISKTEEKILVVWYVRKITDLLKMNGKFMFKKTPQKWAALGPPVHQFAALNNERTKTCYLQTDGL